MPLLLYGNEQLRYELLVVLGPSCDFFVGVWYAQHRQHKGSPRRVYCTSKERKVGCASTTMSQTEWDTGIMGKMN